MDVVAAAAAVCTATCCTNPLDVLKVQLQLHQEREAQRTGRALAAIVRRDGMVVLTSGLPAALSRAAVYGGLRIGLYAPVTAAITGRPYSSAAPAPTGQKMLAGLLSGTLAGLVTTPLELFKVRGQASAAPTRTVVREAVAELGVRGLWRGTLPSATRAAVLTASQMVSYSEAKAVWSRALGREDRALPVQVAAAMTSGLWSTTATHPIDVVKTRMMALGATGLKATGTQRAVQASSMAAVGRDLLQHEGVRGLWKGWLPAYARLGPQTLIILLSLERFRALFGLEAV